MIIRKGSADDLELAAELFDLYRQFYEQKQDLDSAKNFLYDRIKNKESQIFLAIDEDKNKGMGFVQLYPSFSSVSMKRIWILNDLFVHPEYRKHGAASALIKKSIELGKETGAKGIILETQISNANAQKLYEKTGFKKDDEHHYYFYNIDK